MIAQATELVSTKSASILVLALVASTLIAVSQTTNQSVPVNQNSPGIPTRPVDPSQSVSHKINYSGGGKKMNYGYVDSVESNSSKTAIKIETKRFFLAFGVHSCATY